MKIKSNLNSGFTLIEMLVVISIIGVLSSSILVSANSARAKARYARTVSDTRQIASAAALYYDKYGSYPAGVGPTNWAATDTFPAGLDEFIIVKPPPCPNWQYTISQLSDGSTASLLRKVMQGQIVATIFAYTCLQGSCSTLSAVTQLKDFPNNAVTCNEV